MVKWRKRTKSEINKSVESGDYTGGYQFLPWLLWMRSMYVIGLFLNIFAAFSGWKLYSEQSDTIGWIIGLFFTLSSLLISYKIRQDYNDGKGGISR